MLAQTNGDLVEVVGSGLATGIPVPDALADVPAYRLRLKGGAIIDAATQSTFYVDPEGVKHVVNGAGRKVVQCSFDQRLIRDGDGWRTETADDALAGWKSRLAAEVDAAAETERLKYITAGSGQAAVYVAKGEEATALRGEVANGLTPDPADYPLLAAEIGITGANVTAVAEAVLTQKAAWMALAAGIERARLSAKAAIADAADSDAAKSIRDGIAWPNSFGE